MPRSTLTRSPAADFGTSNNPSPSSTRLTPWRRDRTPATPCSFYSTYLHASSTDDRANHPVDVADRDPVVRLYGVPAIAGDRGPDRSHRNRRDVLHLDSRAQHTARGTGWDRTRRRSHSLHLGLHQPDRTAQLASETAHPDGPDHGARAQARNRRCAVLRKVASFASFLLWRERITDWAITCLRSAVRRPRRTCDRSV